MAESRETKGKQTGRLAQSAECSLHKHEALRSDASTYPSTKQGALVHSRHARLGKMETGGYLRLDGQLVQSVSELLFRQTLSKAEVENCYPHAHVLTTHVHAGDQVYMKTKLSNRHTSWNKLSKFGTDCILFSLLSSSICPCPYTKSPSILPSFPFTLYFSLCPLFSLFLSPSPSVC